MKKLLLVLLVPVLVLGLMLGCGGAKDMGDPNPVVLQGTWLPNTVAEAVSPDDVGFIVGGSQTTVFRSYGRPSSTGDFVPDYDTFGNIAYRTAYSGSDTLGKVVNGNDKGPAQFTLEFFWFDGNNAKIGEIKGYFVKSHDWNESFGLGSEATDSQTVKWFQGLLDSTNTYFTSVADGSQKGNPYEDFVVITETKAEFTYQNAMIPPIGIYRRAK